MRDSSAPTVLGESYLPPGSLPRAPSTGCQAMDDDDTADLFPPEDFDPDTVHYCVYPDGASLPLP